MTTNSQLLTTKPTTNKQTNKLSKQLEQEQNHRNRDHMEGYQQGSGRRRQGGKIQRISSINGRQKIDRGRVRIVQEMQKPKNLYVLPMDMNYRGGMWVGGGVQGGGE